MPSTKITPQVSILVPFYNAHPYLRETIENVLGQDFSDFEIIIVNDGSTPPSIESLLSGLDLSKIQIINHDKNKGLSSARNTAFKASKGKYVLPLDADDLLHPAFLSETTAELEKDSSCSAVYTQVQLFGELDLIWKPEADMINLMCGLPIQSTILFKKEVFDSVNGYNSSIKNAPDVDFWIRVLAKGFKLNRLEKPLYLYRKLPESLSTGGQLTEVFDLAQSNLELYEANKQKVFEKEKQKVKKIIEDLNILKQGYIQLKDGYISLRERCEGLVQQFKRKGKKCTILGPAYSESPEFLQALEFIPQPVIADEAHCFKSDWIQHINEIEEEYFRSKRVYRTIELEFQKLEKEYLNLHKLFDESVDQLKQLGIRYQIGKMFGLKQ